MLSSTSRSAVVQSGQDADRCPHRPGKVPERWTELHRRPLGRAGYAHYPTQRLHDCVDGRLRRHRPCLPKAAERADDDLGLASTECRVVKSEAREDPRPEVLDHHIGRQRETEPHRPAER